MEASSEDWIYTRCCALFPHLTLVCTPTEIWSHDLHFLTGIQSTGYATKMRKSLNSAHLIVLAIGRILEECMYIPVAMCSARCSSVESSVTACTSNAECLCPMLSVIGFQSCYFGRLYGCDICFFFS